MMHSHETTLPVVFRLIQLISKLVKEPRVKHRLHQIGHRLPFDEDLEWFPANDDVPHTKSFHTEWYLHGVAQTFLSQQIQQNQGHQSDRKEDLVR